MTICPGRLVEVARRLVGEQESRTTQDRPAQRHPLHLSAGELLDGLRGPVGEPDPSEEALRSAAQGRQVTAADERRHEHVVRHREVRQEVEELKDEPHAIAAAERALAVGDSGELAAEQPDRPAGRRVEARCEVEEGRLPRAAPPDERHHPAGPNLQGDAAQRVEGSAARQHVTLRDVAEGEDLGFHAALHNAQAGGSPLPFAPRGAPERRRRRLTLLEDGVLAEPIDDLALRPEASRLDDELGDAARSPIRYPPIDERRLHPSRSPGGSPSPRLAFPLCAAPGAPGPRQRPLDLIHDGVRHEPGHLGRELAGEPLDVGLELLIGHGLTFSRRRRRGNAPPGDPSGNVNGATPGGRMQGIQRHDIPILTTFDPPTGWDVERVIGPCWGITVRSRSVVGTTCAGCQTFFGGEITMFTELANDSRNEAMTRLEHQAHAHGRERRAGHALRLLRADAEHQRDRRRTARPWCCEGDPARSVITHTWIG